MPPLTVPSTTPLNPLPTLDETLCTACGACVSVCPTRCLSRTEYGPWLARPGDCVRCSACVAVCVPRALSR